MVEEEVVEVADREKEAEKIWSTRHKTVRESRSFVHRTRRKEKNFLDKNVCRLKRIKRGNVLDRVDEKTERKSDRDRSREKVKSN